MLHTYKKLKSIHSLGKPRGEFERALLARLQTTNYKLQTTNFSPLHTFRIPRYATALAVLVLIFAGTGAYAYESPNVVQGHPLYLVKRKMESARVRMARTPEDRARVHLWKMKRRLREAEAMPIYAKTVQTTGAARPDSFAEVEREFKNGVNVIQALPPQARAKAIRDILGKKDALHLQDLAGFALRRDDRLERVGKMLDEERKYLEKNLEVLQDESAREVIKKHLRVREALRDAIETVELEKEIHLDE